MTNNINKERRRSMNATPTRPSNKTQWQGAQADPTKTGQGTDRLITKMIKYDKQDQQGKAAFKTFY
jgi:hypothetical protein